MIYFIQFKYAHSSNFIFVFTSLSTNGKPNNNRIIFFELLYYCLACHLLRGCEHKNGVRKFAHSVNGIYNVEVIEHNHKILEVDRMIGNSINNVQTGLIATS